MFKVGDRVKPNAEVIIANNEACGLPSVEGLFEELDNARGTVTHLSIHRDMVVVKWDDDDMSITTYVTDLIKV